MLGMNYNSYVPLPISAHGHSSVNLMSLSITVTLGEDSKEKGTIKKCGQSCYRSFKNGLGGPFTQSLGKLWL